MNGSSAAEGSSPVRGAQARGSGVTHALSRRGYGPSATNFTNGH